jgi:hypothetical protein
MNTAKFNVWYDMMKDDFIGPFFFQEASMTNHSYLEELEHNTVTQLPCDAWFQHDGKPLCFGNNVRHFLYETSSNKWTGRDSFVLWPPRSPDLTLLEFLYRAYLKNIS